jgi:hypothetical protein
LMTSFRKTAPDELFQINFVFYIVNLKSMVMHRLVGNL